MERKRSRPTQSKTWVTPSKLSIFLDESDELHHFTTDDNGNIQTNKRSWAKRHATVLKGIYNTDENSHISVPAESQLWYCVLSTNGRCSSIGLPNTEVTMILHKNKIGQ